MSINTDNQHSFIQSAGWQALVAPVMKTKTSDMRLLAEKTAATASIRLGLTLPVSLTQLLDTKPGRSTQHAQKVAVALRVSIQKESKRNIRNIHAS